MKVIFLDFDGVINNRGDEDDYIFYPVKDRSGHLHSLPFSASNIYPIKKLFNFLLKENIKIILSTSWRLIFSFEEIEEVFKQFFGLNIIKDNLIIGETSASLNLLSRGEEIEEYLSKHLDIVDYLIIDDNFNFSAKQNSHILLTNPSKGFTINDFIKAESYFNPDEKKSIFHIFK